MQFMALKDIDFSVTPYSVVVARDGVYRVTPAGWAEGGSTTFKFNLTKGTVEKGSFFYVGSASKVIAGYWPKGKSTDISDANWIRALEIQLGDSDATAGDGFGRSTTALLANTSLAVGLAVFEGTEITSTSVPIDAVFYNEPDESFPLDLDNSYLIPEQSDLFNAVNSETGENQPYYGIGTNNFVVSEKVAGDESNWIKMGGIVSSDNWLEKRNPSRVKLNRTSKLSDIEDASGVTFFRKEQ